MERIWLRLEAWLRPNAADVYSTLRTGATEEDLQTVEGELNVQLPRAVKDFYLIHNGQMTDKYGFTARNFLYGWQVPELKRVVQQWTLWKEVLEKGDFDGIHSQPAKGVRHDWWNVKWIPITQNSTGDHLCLDLAPGRGEKVGQMITMWHDAPEREVVGQSFKYWVERFADGLEQGVYVYSKGYGGIIEATDASYYDRT
jgi:cell wall assembly regulator SMI1